MIDKQVQSNDPPSLNQVIVRLSNEGFTNEKIRELLAKVVVKHFKEIVLEKSFNSQKYQADLLKLPKID